MKHIKTALDAGGDHHRQYLTTSDGPSKTTIGRWVLVDDRGWVNGEIPIEDFKFWLLTPDPPTEDEVWKIWIDAVRERED